MRVDLGPTLPRRRDARPPVITLDEAGRRFGRLQIRRPGPPARAAVEHTWIEIADRRRDGVDGPWRIVPDPSGHLLFKLEDAPGGRGSISHTRLAVVGARRRWKDIDVRRRRATIGLRLRPGALGALFGVSADELVDRSVAIEEIAGAQGHELHGRVAELEDPAAIAIALEAFVAERLRRAGALDWRVRATRALIQRRQGRLGAAEIAAELRVSPRTLRAVLRRHAGITTKRFARLARLYHAMRLGQRRGSAGWREVALASGYYDQAHMIREFRCLVGETPTRYLRRAG